MFLFLKKFYYLKKAKKPLDMINKYSHTITEHFDILETDYSIIFFHAWLHVIYCVIFNISSKLEFSISLFLESHLSRFMNDSEVKKFMQLRRDFVKDIFAKIQNFINEPSFIPMMAEIATNFLIEDVLLNEENRNTVVEQLIHYEFAFVKEIKK